MGKNVMKSTRIRFFFWLTMVAILLILALIGPHFIHHDPYAMDLTNVRAKPGGEYIFGTDKIGRCLFCRLVTGAARSIYSAILVVFLTLLIGTVVGIVSGYVGGRTDILIMRLVDVVQAFPSTVFTISVVAMLGKGTFHCILAMTAVSWAGYARLARAQVLSLKERTFVSAARISGMSSASILFRTILPNSLTPLVVSASSHVGSAILSFSGLSFLGLGTAPPYPEWGNMLNEGREMLQTAPWNVLFPGCAILIVVMIMGMFGDSVNEMLNPKKRG